MLKVTFTQQKDNNLSCKDCSFSLFTVAGDIQGWCQNYKVLGFDPYGKVIEDNLAINNSQLPCTAFNKKEQA